MTLRYPGVMIDLPVYYFFLEGRRGGVHDVSLRFHGGSCTPLLTDAVWDTGQILMRLLRGRASTSFLSTPAAFMYAYILSVGLYDGGRRARSWMQSCKHIS